MATMNDEKDAQASTSASSDPPTHDSVLKEALEEIREMNKINAEVLNRNKCSYCCRVDCDCEKVDRQYTCFNGHSHTALERPDGVKLGDTSIQAPCPLYMHRAGNVSVASMSKYSEQEGEAPLWKRICKVEKQPLRQKLRKRAKYLGLVFGVVCIAILVIVMVLAAVGVHRLEDNSLAPPLVAPGVTPAPGQSVYKMDDGSLFVCGHQNGQYDCQIVPDKTG